MSYLTPEFIREQKEKMLAEKQRILTSMNHFKEETKQIGAEVYSDEGDIAQQYLSSKISISLREKDHMILKEIHAALLRIEDGSYGYCQESGELIEQKRLEKQPWARLSLDYAEMEEHESQKYAQQSRRIS